MKATIFHITHLQTSAIILLLCMLYFSSKNNVVHHGMTIVFEINVKNVDVYTVWFTPENGIKIRIFPRGFFSQAYKCSTCVVIFQMVLLLLFGWVLLPTL